MTAPLAPQFAFAACQHGAEAVLKADVARRAPGWRPAFSRPGFVTFKADQPVAKPEGFQLSSAFARTAGLSLGRVEGASVDELAAAVWALPEVATALAQLQPADLHVWQRDLAEPGDHGFEPGPTPAAMEAEGALLAAAPESYLGDRSGARTTPRNRWVLDVAVVEPDAWHVGVHRSTSRAACWAGGVPPIELPPHAVSRAYLKMSEALWWSALPATRGEEVIELGCAPGGAAQALLDAGLKVIGVDPAEMPAEVLEHPDFTHVRRRVGEAPRSLFKQARWLAADMNVAPAYTLDAVESVVGQPDMLVRGMLLTLKLPEWEVVEHLPEYLARIQSWGYRDVRVRQLAFNRQELCVVALRSRGQRRVQRQGQRKPKRRKDGPHSSRGPHQT
ncbi:MAG: hypothetical protein CMJ58_09990 [Planctomycetaceae bacterium]|nr:hypothetical protein [Planctomycetaceae bacterium]